MSNTYYVVGITGRGMKEKENFVSKYYSGYYRIPAKVYTSKLVRKARKFITVQRASRFIINTLNRNIPHIAFAIFQVNETVKISRVS